MKTHIFRILLLALIFAFGTGVRAQVPGTGGSGGMNAALLKLFGDQKPFTAKADVQVLDASTNEIASMPMNFAYRDNKIRVDIDMTQAKSSSMPPGAADQLKAMGMAQIVSILRPDKKQVYVIYPDQKAMMTMPLANKDVKLTKTELGKETVSGHPCMKNKVVIDDGVEKVEATTWDATDLKKFPVRIQTGEGQNTSILNFKDVQFAEPDAARFDSPTGYTTYNSPQELMQGLMSKMTQGGAKK